MKILNRKNHKVPRPLLADAYTIGSEKFESEEALAFSSYALAFRRKLIDIDNILYTNDDNRIIFYGLQQILDEILFDPITHEEIDETIEFLKHRKMTMVGSTDFDFNEKMWRRIVDEFQGRPPIRIDALQEGSVCYPGEPILRVTSTVEGFGQLCAYFEAVLLHVWATSERATACRHWYENQVRLIREIESGIISYKGAITQGEVREYDESYVKLMSGIRLHDFGARAATCIQESNRLGEAHLLSFIGTDTFQASYQAWKNGAKGIGCSVLSQAHRTIAGHQPYYNAYKALYDAANNNEILSQVADLVNYRADVANRLVPLALKSVTEGNGKIIVARPDSAKDFEDLLDQVLYTVKLAEKNNLYTVGANGFKYGTTLKLIVGDSMDWAKMTIMDSALMNRGWAPHGIIIYGVGGYLRNSIKRDNLSAKYYLYEIGKNRRPVLKLSENPGKRTLPTCIVTRESAALNSGKTICSPTENFKDAFVNYYDMGIFGPGMDDNFEVIRDRVLNDFNTMPWNAGLMSDALNKEYSELVKTYAP